MSDICVTKLFQFKHEEHHTIESYPGIIVDSTLIHSLVFEPTYPKLNLSSRGMARVEGLIPDSKGVNPASGSTSLPSP